MNQDEAKKEYDLLVESGELTTLLPGATGEWEKDKNKFLTRYEENQSIIKDAMNLGTILEDDDEDDFYPDW